MQEAQPTGTSVGPNNLSPERFINSDWKSTDTAITAKDNTRKLHAASTTGTLAERRYQAGAWHSNHTIDKHQALGARADHHCDLQNQKPHCRRIKDNELRTGGDSGELPTSCNQVRRRARPKREARFLSKADGGGRRPVEEH